MIFTVRSYLKLYTTIEIKKLADFLEIDEKTLRFMTNFHKIFKK